MKRSMKVMLVAGARPNFMKVASVIDAIREHNASGSPRIDCRLVHTGQHYDAKMSQTFFTELGIPKPDVDLGVGSGSHAQQTGEIIQRFEAVVMRERPDVVMVVGDVNSTIACSLVAAKLLYSTPTAGLKRTHPAIAHVEAGLRSEDRAMPEEVNRVLTDAISDLLFTTEQLAKANLTREGVDPRTVHFVGNTMVDSLLKHRAKAGESTILTRLGLADDRVLTQSRSRRPGRPPRVVPGHRPYGVMTLHRPSNVDDPKVFKNVLSALKQFSRELPIVFPIHPRTQKRVEEFQFERFFMPLPFTRIERGGLYRLEPQGYLDFLRLTSEAAIVLTDSGGLQEETTILGVPCVTLRENTERPITMTQGTNVLAGVEKDDILAHAQAQLTRAKHGSRPRLWDGRAGQRIVKVLCSWARQHRRG